MADITKLSSMMPSSGEVNQKVNLLLDAQAQQETNTNVVSAKVTSMFSNLDRMEESMSIIRKSLNRDIRSRERYYNEEVKLLKKELKTTESLKGSLMNVAALVTGLSLASAVSNFQQGNIGAGARDLTLATGAALSQYLPEVITGSAIIISQLLGFGKRGSVRPNAGMRTGLSPRPGAGKLGLLLPILGLLGLGALSGKGSEGNADKVRGELVRKQLVTDQTINQPDVDRFKLQLERFSFLIDRLQSDRVDQISPIIPTGSVPKTAADGTKITSSGLFPNLMKNERLIELQNILQDQTGGSLDQIGGKTVPVTEMTLSQINEFQNDLEPGAASGVGLFNVDDPLGGIEEMFEAKGLDFDPSKILFTEQLQREYMLFKLNQVLPEDMKLSPKDLKPFEDMDVEMLNNSLQLLENIRPNNTKDKLFDISPLFEVDKESDTNTSSGDKVSSNTFVMPNTNKNVAMIDGNSSSASVTVSTDYTANDGVTIDNFHNIIQYDSPAVFGGVTV